MYWQTRSNQFRDALQAGAKQLAMWVNIPWPPLVEIAGAAGLNVALIDMEHTSNSFADVDGLILACERAGVCPIVRPAGHNPNDVSRVLDSGAQGVIYPDVRTAEQARRAVTAAKYPPEGQRGWGGSHTRYAMWEGLSATAALRETSVDRRGVYSQDYVAKVNTETLVFLIVETPDGVRNIDEIVEVPGVDNISFGWADYSASVNFDLSQCEAAAETVYATCKNHGIGTSLSTSPADLDRFYPGCYFIAGIDTLLLSGKLREALAAAHQRVR